MVADEGEKKYLKGLDFKQKTVGGFTMEELNYDQIEQMERENWWYKGKRDLFDNLLKGKKFHHVLDIGCGVGCNMKILSKYADIVVGVDNSLKAVEYCQQKGFGEVFQGDMHSLSFADDSFDLVVCSDVLEHIDDKKALKEISRVLHSSGTLMFSVPAHHYLWNDNDDFSHHLRRYEKKRLKWLLSKDFRLVRLGYWNFFSYFPCLIVYPLQRLWKKQKLVNNLTLIPQSLNKILYSIISLENTFFQKCSLPQGVSLIGIARRK